MQEIADAEIVQQYGEREPTFGGVYFEGDVLVAMFTADLDRHHERLRPRLRVSENFRTTLAARTYTEVEASNARVQRRLMHTDRPRPEMFGVGISMRDGQFVVCVKVEQLTDRLVEAIRAEVSPDVVVIEQGHRPDRD